MHDVNYIVAYETIYWLYRKKIKWYEEPYNCLQNCILVVQKENKMA
jgi:hypothetical protein